MAQKLTVVVLGSTGKQGGAVARGLLERGHTVRAITRDANSPQAKSLASAGAQLVATPLDDAAAIRKALEGATSLFSVTLPYGGTNAEVRARPADPKLRIFLFQLLCVLGQWERALNQLTVASELDPEALAMRQIYGSAVPCEAARAEVFDGKRSPMIFGEPDQWLALLIESLLVGGRGERGRPHRTFRGARARRADRRDQPPADFGRAAVRSAAAHDAGDPPPAQ